MKIGVFQGYNCPGDTQGNLNKAENFISQHRDLDLIAFPELFACGFSATRDIWEYAEPEDGPTVGFCRRVSREHSVYICMGFLLKKGRDYYNSYFITDPEGRLAGTVNKRIPEAGVFKRSKRTIPSDLIIKTGLGNIAVLICSDSHRTALARQLIGQELSMVILPHAWSMENGDDGAEEECIETLDRLYCERFGVPALYVNCVGSSSPTTGLFASSPSDFRMHGKSAVFVPGRRYAVCPGNAESWSSEECLVTSVKVGEQEVPDHFGWIDESSFIMSRIIFPADDLIGDILYLLHRTIGK